MPFTQTHRQIRIAIPLGADRLLLSFKGKETLSRLFKYRFRLGVHYRERDYCVQYRESDFRFISHLMEPEARRRLKPEVETQRARRESEAVRETAHG